MGKFPPSFKGLSWSEVRNKREQENKWKMKNDSPIFIQVVEQNLFEEHQQIKLILKTLLKTYSQIILIFFTITYYILLYLSLLINRDIESVVQQFAKGVHVQFFISTIPEAKTPDGATLSTRSLTLVPLLPPF